MNWKNIGNTIVYSILFAMAIIIVIAGDRVNSISPVTS